MDGPRTATLRGLSRRDAAPPPCLPVSFSDRSDEPLLVYERQKGFIIVGGQASGPGEPRAPG